MQSIGDKAQFAYEEDWKQLLSSTDISCQCWSVCRATVTVICVKKTKTTTKKKKKQSGRMISEVLCRHVISLFSKLPANDPLECYNVHFWSGFGRKLFTWNHDEISLLAGQEGPRLARVPGEPLKVSHLPSTARFIRHNYTISGGGASAAFAPLHGWEVTQTLRFPPPLRMRWGRINARLNKKQDVNSGGGGRRLITSRH